LFYRSDNYSLWRFQGAVSVGKYDFENFDYYHHVSDEFKVMDIGHMTYLFRKCYQQWLKWQILLLRKFIWISYWRYGLTHIVS
jgi:hypothetical protein